MSVFLTCASPQKWLKDFSFLTYLWWTICLLVIFTQCVSRTWASMNKSRYYATYLQFSFLLCTQLHRPLRRCEYFLRNPWNNYAHTFRWTTWLFQLVNPLIPYCFCCKSLLLSHKKIVSFYKELLVINSCLSKHVPVTSNVQSGRGRMLAFPCALTRHGQGQSANALHRDSACL